MSAGTVPKVCIALYLAVIALEAMVRRQRKRFILQAALLALVVTFALLTYSAANGRMSFGPGTPPVATVVIMFATALCGIAARYIFYLRIGQFSWFDFLKPLVITPIVLLPLIGSVQSARDLSGVQVLSLAVLAFQNGFFWRAVLVGGAKPMTRAATPASGGT